MYAKLGRLLGGRAVGAVIGLAHLVIATRTLGPEGFGVLVLVSGFATMVGGIAEFPSWHAIIRYGAEALASGDDARLVRLLRFTTLVEVAGGITAIAAAALLGSLYGARLGWSAAAVSFAIPYSLATLASIRSVPAAYLQLHDRYDLLAAHAVVQPMLRSVGAALAALGGAGLRGFLIVWLIAAVAECAVMWGMALFEAHRRIGIRRLWGLPRGVLSENDRLISFMLGANADVTFGDLAGRLLPLAIGWWSGPAPAALYNVAQRSTVLISQPAELFGRTAYGEFAQLVAAGNRDTLFRTLLRSTLIALTASLPLVLVAAMASRPIAELLGGSRFAGAAPLMLWLIGTQAILLVAPPTTAALVALGRPGLSLGANFVSRLIPLPLLPWLLDRHGLTGAGIQSVTMALATAASLVLLLVIELRSGQPAR